MPYWYMQFEFIKCRVNITCCLFSDFPPHHYQLDHFSKMLHRHHTAQILSSSLCNWKSTFLRPLTGWNLSFEDIKSSILATGACDTTKDPWSRKDRRFEHNEEEGETSVNPLMSFTLLYSCPCAFPQKPWLCHQSGSYGKTAII